MARYKITVGGVFNTETGESIPDSSDNKDWREYLEWAKKNTADPADIPPAAPKYSDKEKLDALWESVANENSTDLNAIKAGS